ncbi:MAG: hypothetical protein ABI995_01045 [Acidobacteriota bacterium]
MSIARAFFCTFLMLPGLLLAQTDADFKIPESGAPADVNQSLRERADLFFKYHVGTTNRKALDLVAEDTKDEYFTSGKMLLIKYALTDVRYMEGFTKARVVADATREWGVQTDVVVVTLPMVTTWKIEDGKWMWYHDRLQDWNTPMGPSAANSKPVQLLRQDENGNINLPKDFANPNTLMAQAQAILQQSKIDRDAVTLVYGKPSDEQVVFQNGYQGEVALELSSTPAVPGLTVTLAKANLARAENGIVKFHYDPPAGKETDTHEQVQHRVQLTVQPFNQTFLITLNLNPAQ